MILLALLISAAAAPEAPAAPRLQVADGIDCPTEAQIQSALNEHFGPDRPEDSEGPLLEVARDPAGQLDVRLSSSSAKTFAEKKLDAHQGSCKEVAQTIALLTKSWLADLAQETPPPPPPQAPLPPAVVTSEAPPPRFDRPYRLSAWLAAEAAFGSTATFGGSLALELSLPKRFGVGLQFSLPGALVGTGAGGGSMTVDRQLLALLATFALIPPESARSFSLGAVLGPTLLHYSARSQGYPQPGNAEGLEPGLIFGLRGMLPIFKGFFCYGELDGNAIANALHFEVGDGAGGATTLVTQPSFWGSLSLGVGLQFL